MNTEVHLELANKFLHFDAELETGEFNLKSHHNPALMIKGAELSVCFQQKNKKVILGEDWTGYAIKKASIADKRFGAMDMLTLSRGFVDQNVSLKISFALPDSLPMLLWKMELGNFGASAIRLKEFNLLSLDERKVTPITFSRSGKADLAFYSNGWQTWSRSAVYGAKERMWQTNVRFLQGQQWINRTTPMPRSRGHFTSEFFAVVGDRISRLGWVLGFLSQKQQFGMIKANLGRRRKVTMTADGDDILITPGTRIETDWAALIPIEIDEADPLGVYIEAVARENDIKLTKPKMFGWCSWYEMYTRIDDGKIRRNLDAVIANQNILPLQLFQIDDGYESQVGDWLKVKKSFPSGVAPFARTCKEHGITAGLWQAPFIVHPRSRLAREHPEWLLRNKKGGLANTGWNWSVFTTALDLTHPGAVQYLDRVTKTAVRDWGFGFLKLDFLYAAAITGRHKDLSQTRAQIIRSGMQTIRKAAGSNTFLLGCGAPLGSMLGWVDGMRIGADMLDKWLTKVPGATWFLKHEANTPSVRNAIQNILTRAMFHNRWWINDPDVLLLREKAELSLEEIQSAASMIAMTGGMLMLSDNLPGLTHERLRIAQQITPALDQRPWILDWFDRQTPRKLRLDFKGASGEWWLISYSNWSDSTQIVTIDPEEFKLPKRQLIGRSFWDGRIFEFSHQQPLLLVEMAPHQTVVLAVRQWDPEKMTYLGSDMHISQGLEVASIQKNHSITEVILAFPKRMSGIIDLYDPRRVRSARIGGNKLQVEEIQAKIFRIHLTVDQKAKILIEH